MTAPRDPASDPAPPSPADVEQGVPAGPSLSPSRAADFKTCPLLFRFRTIDRLPETPSADQARGTLVHAVLERLFDLPAAERTPAAAAALVAPQWERLIAEEPELAALFPEQGAPPAPRPAAPAGDAAPAPAGSAGPERADETGAGPAAEAGAGPAAEAGAEPALPGMPEPAAAGARLDTFLAGAGELLDGYFAVEDPSRLEPAERETLISTLVGDRLLIRGYVDRLDVSPAGDLRVVDYKTGGAPREAFEGRALFQLKFYALVLMRTRGVVPRVLRLLYLKDREVCDYRPEAAELERFERTLLALSEAIEQARVDGDFRPRPSRLCDWCSHQSRCPAFGGTPPPYPGTTGSTTETAGPGAALPMARPTGTAADAGGRRPETAGAAAARA